MFGIVLLVLVFGGGIGGVIAIVALRNAARRNAQGVTWSDLARRHTGQFVPGRGLFGGNTITFQRADGVITIETCVLSAMQASASPYHADAGTFTHVRASYVGENGPQKIEVDDEGKRHLPPTANIYSSPTEVIVVMPGAVADPAALEAALRIVERSTERASRPSVATA